MADQRRARVDDVGPADLVDAPSLDVATEDELRLIPLDDPRDDGAAHMLTVPEPVAGRPRGRGVARDTVAFSAVGSDDLASGLLNTPKSQRAAGTVRLAWAAWRRSRLLSSSIG